MRSPRAVVFEEIRRRGDPKVQVRDIAARIRVWRRGPHGKAQPAELLERVYGGRFVQALRAYEGEVDPATIAELSAHPGQLELLLHDDEEAFRLLAIGPPGGGKTMGAVTKAVTLALDRPCSTGGFVAPDQGKRIQAFNDFISIVQPKGWIVLNGIDKSVQSAWVVTLVNGTRVMFIGGRKASGTSGSPAKQYSWDWAVEDEQQNISDETVKEVNFRGRSAGRDFRVYSTATDDLVPEFQIRLEAWRTNPRVKIVHFAANDNVFVDPEHWERQRDFLSAEEYERIIDVTGRRREGRIYGDFDSSTPSLNIRRVPDIRTDITGDLTAERFSEAPRRYIVSWDPGSAVHSSHVLKAFTDHSVPGGRVWFVVDEIVSTDVSSEVHIDAVAEWCRRHSILKTEVVIILDPHYEKKKLNASDKSDLQVARNAGFAAYPASRHQISLRHRFGMVNALLCDSRQRRVLFVACDEKGTPCAPMAVRSFRLYRRNDRGEPDQANKGKADLSHYTDDVGYGLFPFEQHRGRPTSENAKNREDDRHGPSRRLRQ